MDLTHIDYLGETASCAICEAEIYLPKDDRTWPTPKRVRYGKTWIQVSPVKRRPGGSVGIELPPRLDMLVEFILAHRICAGDCGPLPEPAPPPRRPVCCVLGPVTIVPGQVYRIVVVDGEQRERREFPTMEDAMDGVEAAQEELAHKHDGEGR